MARKPTAQTETAPKTNATAKSAPRRHKKAMPAHSPEGRAPIPQEQIEQLAYSYWEARGGHGGSPELDWLRAEEELKSR
jgi:hypothetical protein